MKNLFLGFLLLASFTLARADFMSYTLISQSHPLTYDPVTSFTFDTLTINFTGNSGGQANFTQDSATGAVVTLNFTSDRSIIGDVVQLAWIYPSDGNVFEYFPSIVVPGAVFLCFGASNFTITDNTITIANSTQGWTGAEFNGFVLTDLTRQAQGPSSSAPEASSTLALLAVALAGIAACRRGFAFVRG
jgi:hypothetical protein